MCLASKTKHWFDVGSVPSVTQVCKPMMLHLGTPLDMKNGDTDANVALGPGISKWLPFLLLLQIPAQAPEGHFLVVRAPISFKRESIAVLVLVVLSKFSSFCLNS